MQGAGLRGWELEGGGRRASLRRPGGALPPRFGCRGAARCRGEVLEAGVLRDVPVSVGVPLRTHACRQEFTSTFSTLYFNPFTSVLPSLFSSYYNGMI